MHSALRFGLSKHLQACGRPICKLLHMRTGTDAQAMDLQDMSSSRMAAYQGCRSAARSAEHTRGPARARESL